MKKKLGKKGAFETINAGMIAFLGFVLIVVLTILLISTLKSTSIVCSDTYDDGVCLTCPSVGDANWTYNASANICCNFNQSTTNCNIGNTTGYTESSGAAYNGTKDLQDAAGLPPQFAQIIVIVIIIVGILGMLAFIGYGAYDKLKR